MTMEILLVLKMTQHCCAKVEERKLLTWRLIDFVFPSLLHTVVMLTLTFNLLQFQDFPVKN